MPPKRARPAWSALTARLRALEQGDLISFGAIGIAVRSGSAIAELAGLSPDEGRDVVSLAIETSSGWYAVLSQDCDIVRGVDIEPCLTVAPVLFIPQDEWRRLHVGQSNYRCYPLPPDSVTPVDPAHADRIPVGHEAVVDIRYIGVLDKTALLPDVAQRHILIGRHKLAFQQWVGARFGRESFADPVHERVLPAARVVLADALTRASSGRTGPDSKVIASVSEWYVRATDRYVEVMGRLDTDRGRAAGVLRKQDAVTAWNTASLEDGCALLTKAAAAALRGGGYAVRFTVRDFTELRADEFETYAYWAVQDDPPPAR